jgi:hypothetical protein
VLVNSPYECGDAGCRRIGIDARPGERVELEVTPVDDQQMGRWGLVTDSNFPFVFDGFFPNVTTESREVWIVGYAAGKVTLTARAAR